MTRTIRLLASTLLPLSAALLCPQDVVAQHALQPSHFDLSEVQLTDGPFYQSQNLNIKSLLNYDVDCLLTPFLRQSGLSRTQDVNSKYYGWEDKHQPSTSFASGMMSMDGHLGARYLSALSISYAACDNASQKAELKKRVDYMINILNDCQKQFDGDKRGLKGYIGGLPNNEIWTALYDGDYRVYNQNGNWIPFYCVQKTLSALRDAYIYTGSETAKTMWKKMTEWTIDQVRLFKEDIMEMQILQWEPGEINEVLADAYQVFGDTKYLNAAKKFSHQIMIENMREDPGHSFLDLKHCVECTAKFVGFARIDQLQHDKRYREAVDAFWDDVVSRRTTCIGGQGIGSFYQPADKGPRYINEPDGPEACATYEMLKLTSHMFSETRNPRYAEYYEQALVNHVFASQDHQTGGYTYYTPLRPESYHIYSTANESQWCCVGSGMESHSNYGDFIYTHSDDTLFVNLFIASKLKNEEFQLTQESSFPYGNKSVIRIEKDFKQQLAVRHPSWTGAKFNITVNGAAPKGFDPAKVKAGTAEYIGLGRNWKAGDVIEITYPMSWSFLPCPNYRNYIALKLGPVVMAAVTSSEQQGASNYEKLTNEYAREGSKDYFSSIRMKTKNVAFAPMLICDQNPQAILSRFKVRDGKTLTFDVNCKAEGSVFETVELRPFFSVDHERYTVYWNQIPENVWLRSPLYLSELKGFEIQKATWDVVSLGDDADEKQHDLKTSQSATKGMLNDQWFRDAQPDQWFEVALDATKSANVAATDSVVLLCQVFINDRGRQSTVSVNGTSIGQLVIPQSWPGVNNKNRIFNMPIKVPASLVKGQDKMRVRFSAGSGPAPRLFSLRVIPNNPKLL